MLKSYFHNVKQSIIFVQCETIQNNVVSFSQAVTFCQKEKKTYMTI